MVNIIFFGKGEFSGDINLREIHFYVNGFIFENNFGRGFTALGFGDSYCDFCGPFQQVVEDGYDSFAAKVLEVLAIESLVSSRRKIVWIDSPQVLMSVMSLQ